MDRSAIYFCTSSQVVLWHSFFSKILYLLTLYYMSSTVAFGSDQNSLKSLCTLSSQSNKWQKKIWLKIYTIYEDKSFEKNKMMQEERECWSWGGEFLVNIDGCWANYKAWGSWLCMRISREKTFLAEEIRHIQPLKWTHVWNTLILKNTNEANIIGIWVHWARRWRGVDVYRS